MPLRRFNSFLDRMTPGTGYGGLLSPADERAAGRDMRMLLASGLLSAAGPQRMPVSLGQAIAASIPPAMEARDRRAEIGVRNEQLRRQIDAENRQSAARARMSEAVRGMGGPDAELAGLLSEVNPAAASEMMLSGILGGGSEEPTDVRTMRAIGLPLTPEGFAQFNELKGDSETKQLIDALGLQIQSVQLANMRRDQQVQEQQARETRLTRENAIERGIDQTIKIADLTKKLEGTALAAGLPASEWRRSGMGALAAVGGALGLDMNDIQSEITSFDQLKKNLNDQLISLMSAGTLGQATDSKLQQYRDSLASPDTAPGAVMAIQAGIAETLLDQADVLQIEVPNRDKIEASIEEMKHYQPAGTETVLDVPAAVSAGRRAVVRAADIARMGVEQLNQLDPAQMTPELLEAARKRWDEISAR